MEDLIELAWKAGVASAVLMLVVVAGQRAGPLLASIAMTYPFNSGVGFSLMMWERADPFMAEAGLAAFALTGGVFAFMVGYARATVLGGFFKPWAIGVVAWFGVAAASLALDLTWLLAVLLAGGGALAAGLLIRKPEAPPVAAGGGAGSWRATIARAIMGGLFIGLVAVYSKLLGPLISGMLLALPTMMSASLWILHRRFGEAFAVETIYRSRWALASYASFVATVGLFSLSLGGIGAVVLGAGVAAAVSLAMFRVGGRQ